SIWSAPETSCEIGSTIGAWHGLRVTAERLLFGTCNEGQYTHVEDAMQRVELGRCAPAFETPAGRSRHLGRGPGGRAEPPQRPRQQAGHGQSPEASPPHPPPRDPRLSHCP